MGVGAEVEAGVEAGPAPEVVVQNQEQALLPADIGVPSIAVDHGNMQLRPVPCGDSQVIRGGADIGTIQIEVHSKSFVH